MLVPASIRTKHADLAQIADVPLVGGLVLIVVGLGPPMLFGFLLSDIPVRLVANAEFLVMTPLSLVPVGPLGIVWEWVLRKRDVRIAILWLPVWALSLVYTAMGVVSLLHDPDLVTIYWVDLVPHFLRERFGF